MSRKTAMILRTIFLVVSILNQFFVSAASLTDLIDNQTFKIVYNVISVVLTATASAISWWFNNSVTTEAQMADEYLDVLKNNIQNNNECGE